MPPSPSTLFATGLSCRPTTRSLPLPVLLILMPVLPGRSRSEYRGRSDYRGLLPGMLFFVLAAAGRAQPVTDSGYGFDQAGVTQLLPQPPYVNIQRSRITEIA